MTTHDDEGTARALSEEYDALYRRTGFEDSPQFYGWIVRQLRVDNSDRVLDIGCGRGGALHALECSGVAPIGLDLSAEALTQARPRVRAPLVQGDGGRLPFADESFDHVLNLGNLEHFDDWRAGVREMARVLRPAGRAWVLLPNLFYSGAIWRAIRFGEGPNHHQPIDRFATRAEWQAILEAGGLAVERSVPYHKGKWWKRLLPSNLAWHFLYECRKGPESGETALPPLERRVLPQKFTAS